MKKLVQLAVGDVVRFSDAIQETITCVRMVVTHVYDGDEINVLYVDGDNRMHHIILQRELVRRVKKGEI